MRYLHVQAEPIMRNFSKLMISHGNYNLLQHTDVPHHFVSPPATNQDDDVFVDA